MSLRERILLELVQVGFRTGDGAIAPFGQPLPLVTAWALDDETASLAVLVEDPTGVEDEDPWRELLFALSGLRHELRDGRRSALGTPVVIALLKTADDERRLRRLVEDLSAQYLLFSRVELNVVVGSDPDVSLDRALAPLLPNCRRALIRGSVVGREVLESLAGELRKTVAALSEDIEPILRPGGQQVARRYAEQLSEFVLTSGGTGPVETDRWDRISLANFRSFDDVHADFGGLTLLDGLNGTGKSSLIEALEILWAGTSQRKPADESPDRYDQHLARDGKHPWSITGWTSSGEEPKTARATEPTATASALARIVFSQDGAIDIARERSETRYSELLRVTGLAIPELLHECERLNRDAKANVDRTLAQLAIPGLARISARAVDHVRTALRIVSSSPAPTLAAVTDVAARAAELAARNGLALKQGDVVIDGSEHIAELEKSAVALSAQLRTAPEHTFLARSISQQFRTAAQAAEERARGLEALRAALEARRQYEAPPREAPSPADGVPSAVAATWLQTARTLRRSAVELQSALPEIDDLGWRKRLAAFVERAERTLADVPFDELERFAQTVVRDTHRALEPLDEALFDQAGFALGAGELASGEMPPELMAALAELARSLRAYASDATAFADAVLTAPLVRLEGLEEELANSLAQFEVAKRLKAPLTQAQETMLDRLISGPLEPLLVELIAAMTRFEWYFHSFKMTVEAGRVRLAGLATESDELDLRMLLNAGERVIVTIAWFLALHLLQPPIQRRALVLDDPFSGLDENNQAALIATLRILARLTKPDLLVISCHDRAVSDAVEREFAAVAGWPVSFSRLHFARSADGTSVIEGSVEGAPASDYELELAKLGLGAPGQLTLAERT